MLFVLLSFLWTTIRCQDTCISTPQSPNCTNYWYPDSLSRNITEDQCSGTSDMNSMSVCQLLKLCNSTTQDTGPYCNWFSLYKESCTEMRMPPCADLIEMCQSGSVVNQCKMDILNLPKTGDMHKNNSYMCNQMPGMTGCSCTDCSDLEMYGELCKEMQGGPGCYAWSIFCQKIPDWTICSNSPGDIIPVMRMYFHWGFYDVILFKDWIPYNALTYAISLICVFFISVIHEGYKVLKINMELRWKINSKYETIRDTSTVNSQPALSLAYGPFDWKRDGIRALYRTIDVAFHFFIMLIAMTFNGGLFIAVVLGYGAGSLIFSRLSKPQTISGSSLSKKIYNCH